MERRTLRSGRAPSADAPERRRPATVVSIAASDSGGGAGIQADLLTFTALGVHGATVLTAATAQNTRSVTAVEPLSTRLIARQMDAVFGDLRPSAVKIGMLYDAPRIRAVAAGLRRHRRRVRNVVVDPVMVAKAGARLLSRPAVAALCRDLLPLADLVTPNLPEAAVLARMRVRSDAERRIAAAAIYDLGPRAVLVKGGHGRGAEVCDLLYDGRFFTQFRMPRIRTRATHGTGCTLSSAIAANLALGYPLEDAIVRAIRYLRGALERGYFPGRGFGVPGRIAR